MYDASLQAFESGMFVNKRSCNPKFAKIPSMDGGATKEGSKGGPPIKVFRCGVCYSKGVSGNALMRIMMFINVIINQVMGCGVELRLGRVTFPDDSTTVTPDDWDSEHIHSPFLLPNEEDSATEWAVFRWREKY